MDNELIILKKYKHSHIIEERDLPILDKYDGLITYGITLKDKVFKLTAHLNKRGKWFVNRQILLSHPLTRFIYNILIYLVPIKRRDKNAM